LGESSLLESARLACLLALRTIALQARTIGKQLSRIARMRAGMIASLQTYVPIANLLYMCKAKKLLPGRNAFYLFFSALLFTLHSWHALQIFFPILLQVCMLSRWQVCMKVFCLLAFHPLPWNGTWWHACVQVCGFSTKLQILLLYLQIQLLYFIVFYIKRFCLVLLTQKLLQ